MRSWSAVCLLSCHVSLIGANSMGNTNGLTWAFGGEIVMVATTWPGWPAH